MLLDVDDDSTETLDAISTYMMVESDTFHIVATRTTVSGYHIVFKACDTRGLLAYCKISNIDAEIKRDSLIFIEKYQGERL